MRKLLQIIAFATIFSSACEALAQNVKWLTDYDKAIEQAKAENKPVLINFTGSDWCGWCMKMVEDTLSKREFKRHASENLVLLEADYPRRKQQSKKEKEQNQELKERYGVDGFPTFVLIDKDGNQLGRQGGYLDGGPEAFIAKIESFKK